MREKWIKAIAAAAAFLLGVVAMTQPVMAQVDPTPYEAKTYSDVFITALLVSDRLEYVELYNTLNTAVDLRSWYIAYDLVPVEPTEDEEVIICTLELQQYLLPKSYGLLAAEGVVAAGPQVLTYESCSDAPGLYVREIRLMQGGEIQETVLPTIDDVGQPWVRRGLTTTYRTGEFGGTTATNRDFVRPDIGANARPQVYIGGWYTSPADNGGLEIVEVLANPDKCSPLSASLPCGDYVKVFVGNASDEIIAQYAVRSDSGGTKRTSSNGADLANYPVTDDGYITVPISLTNSGGYVWLEDVWGLQRYAESVQEYPDASSTKQRGHAWALADGTWQWTATPRPDAANQIYMPPPPVQATRAVSSLVPCREGQVRNPATNRCRSIVEAVAQYVPCNEGQERNPLTNRCRAVQAASTTLVPCQEGYERNPATNRCRRITLASSALPRVTDIETEAESSRAGWVVAGAVVAVAVGIGIYEWRGDLHRRFKIGSR